MEEYTQITMDQWMQWKEDIREKLAETAGNFVYIGYRLKQIRASGMYGGAADIFGFAKQEYGLGKSTVSRFIAINEKYSEGGNSLELKEEFQGFSSSKLAEMLTLPDSEIELITEKTTIREIRDLKNFNAQAMQEYPEEEITGQMSFADYPVIIPGTEGKTETEEKDQKVLGIQGTEASEQEAVSGLTPGQGCVQPSEDVQARTPLEKCIIDFFREKKKVLYDVMRYLGEDEPDYKAAAELMAPSGQASHRRGIVFLFLYGWAAGIKYKLMTQPEPISMSWPDLLELVRGIYQDYQRPGFWKELYGEPVATSQQEKAAESRTGTNSRQEKSGKEKPAADSVGEKEKTVEALKIQGAETSGSEPDNLEIVPGTGAVEISEEREEADGEEPAAGDEQPAEYGDGSPAADVQEGSPAAAVTGDRDTTEESAESAGTAEGGGCEEDPGAGSTLTDLEIENIWDEITDYIDDLDDFRREYRRKELDQILVLELKDAYHKAVDLAAGLEKLLIDRGGKP